MSLPAGTRLGAYEIVGLLGEGGMGEVYRARDTRLGRAVAIKILQSTYASAPDRVERFAREARAAATLNHPNILAVYDVGVAEQGPYLVSELLEGETLRTALVPHRPWSARQVREVAVQIASGLAAAHARGIVHRDIKPENLFRCDDGVVKILDFGLARLADLSDASVTGLAPTLTREHTVVGTVGYMAPEQVRGDVADHRADLFAFGAVLYEMLSGQRAFARETPADTMAAILDSEPVAPAALEGTAPQLVRIVLRCLEKRPEARFQSASDLAFALGALSSSGISRADGTGVNAAGRPAGRRSPAVLMAVSLLVAAAAGVFIGRQLAPAPDATRLPVVHRITEGVGLEETPAISPDGRSVAYTAGVDGRRQVFVRLVAGGTPLQLTRTELGCEFPRWSHDSNSVLCFSPAPPGSSQGSVWEVPALGGTLRRVADSVGEADARSGDGALVYFRLTGDQIELVTAAGDGSGGASLARFPAGSYFWHPRWSPDGRFVAFQRGDGLRFDLFVVPVEGGDARQLTHDNALIRGLSWLPDSRGILYSSSRGTTMPYLPGFSLWTVGLGGQTARRLTSQELSYVDPDVQRDGRVVLSRMHLSGDIWRFPVGGTPLDNVRAGLRVTRQTGHVQTPSVSPDGRAVAFLSDSGGHANIWVTDLETGELRQITHERDPAVAIGLPLWSPDRRAIAFLSTRGNAGFGFGIWTVNPDGADLRQLVQQGFGASWSADGRWIYYVERASGSLKKVAASGGTPVTVRANGVRNVIGLDGSRLFYVEERPLVDGTPEFLIRVAALEGSESRVLARVPATRSGTWQILNPAMSPDGKWFAQALTDGFTTNIWVHPTAEGDWRQITDFGDRVTFIARRVDWSPDGGFIYAALADGDADIVLLEGLLARPSS